MSFLTLISCKNNANNSTDVIQIWYYGNGDSTKITEEIARSAKSFCEQNNIPIEVVHYDDSTISYADYIFKRNLAASKGNMITIGDIRDIEDLSNQHADYSKLENYDKLIDGFKNRFCIPLGVNYILKYLKNDIMQYYNIAIDKTIITYTEYLIIKQEMKKNGARFDFSGQEFRELRDYYLIKNGVSSIDEDSDILKGDKLKEIMKKVSLEVYEDILLYYDIDLQGFEPVPGEYNVVRRNIFDKNSGLKLLDVNKYNSLYEFTNPEKYNLSEDFEGTTLCIDPTIGYSSPNFFMYKKITNDQIYDLANHIVKEGTYVNLRIDAFYLPTFKIDKLRKVLKLNEELELDEKYDVISKKREITNEIYKIYIKDKEKSKELADFHFFGSYNYYINYYIRDIVKEIAKSLSSNGTTLEKYDASNAKIEKIIDDKINELILNLHVKIN
jgi:hypothetical protein